MSKPVQLIWSANFFIHLAVYRYFRLPNLKFGLHLAIGRPLFQALNQIVIVLASCLLLQNCWT